MAHERLSSQAAIPSSTTSPSARKRSPMKLAVAWNAWEKDAQAVQKPPSGFASFIYSVSECPASAAAQPSYTTRFSFPKSRYHFTKEGGPCEAQEREHQRRPDRFALLTCELEEARMHKQPPQRAAGRQQFFDLWGCTTALARPPSTAASKALASATSRIASSSATTGIRRRSCSLSPRLRIWCAISELNAANSLRLNSIGRLTSGRGKNTPASRPLRVTRIGSLERR